MLLKQSRHRKVPSDSAKHSSKITLTWALFVLHSLITVAQYSCDVSSVPLLITLNNRCRIVQLFNGEIGTGAKVFVCQRIRVPVADWFVPSYFKLLSSESVCSQFYVN